jgi:hypothetical protein
MKFSPYDKSKGEAVRTSKPVAVEDLEIDRDFDSDGIPHQVKAAFRVDRYGR